MACLEICQKCPIFKVTDKMEVVAAKRTPDSGSLYPN